MNKKQSTITFLNLVIAGKIREAYDTFIGNDFRHHNPYFPGDRESLLNGMEDAEKQFPNKVFEIQHVLEDGEFVAVHSKLRLAPEKPFMATVHIVRFQGDRIIEMWDIGQEGLKESPNQYWMF